MNFTPLFYLFHPRPLFFELEMLCTNLTLFIIEFMGKIQII